MRSHQFNHNEMTQDGTFSSIYGLCITALLTIAAHITLSDILTICAIIAALTTTAVNVKNFLKKDKTK